MTHPFAGGLSYPWARDEAYALYEVLVQDVQDADQIDLLHKRVLPQHQPLFKKQAPGVLWKQVLEQVATAGALLELCTLLREFPGAPRVNDAAQAMLDAKAAIEKRISRDGRVTVDRTVLRKRLAQLSERDGAVKVLLVRGAEKTGKTWSRHLFQQAARDQGAEVTYVYKETVGSVTNLFKKLFSTLQASDRIPPADTTASAWYEQVCIQLQAEAQRCGRPLWIAVDDLGPGPDGVTPLLDPDIRSFLDQFVLHLLDPAMSQWFRLLLIHYPDGEVPTKWERELWDEDRPEASDVQAGDIADVLREWAACHRRQLLDDQVLALAGEVITDADAPLAPGPAGGDPPRLRRIHDRLAATLDNLAGPGA